MCGKSRKHADQVGQKEQMVQAVSKLLKTVTRSPTSQIPPAPVYNKSTSCVHKSTLDNGPAEVVHWLSCHFHAFRPTPASKMSDLEKSRRLPSPQDSSTLTAEYNSTACCDGACLLGRDSYS